MAGYKYRGDQGTMTDAEVQARVDAARARAQGKPVPAAPAQPAPVTTGKPRCEDCGYLLTRCCCPGGPRGGA